jgi:hypothetical protein
VSDGDRPLPALRLADSLARQRPDELIAVGRDGVVISRKQVRRRMAVYYGLLGAASATAIALSPVFGIPYAAILGGIVLMKRRRIQRLNRVVQLLRADRLDEVDRELDTLERRDWRSRALAAYARAGVAVRRGQLDTALASTERCASLMPSVDRAMPHVYWMNLFLRASILLELRRLGDASPVIERAMAAPDGEVYALFKRGIEAQRAFARGQDDELGTDDQLHDRARDALGYNQTGITVAILAWAYERRGDIDMSAHLLGEVVARCPHGVEAIASAHPSLWAWLEPKLAALPRDED